MQYIFSLQVLRLPVTQWNPVVDFSAADCKLIKAPSGMRDELKEHYDSDLRSVLQPYDQIPQHFSFPGC